MDYKGHSPSPGALPLCPPGGNLIPAVPPQGVLGGEGVSSASTHAVACLAGSRCLAECPESLPCAVLHPQAEDLEEDTPGASLWPTTVTLLTLFLLSLFYSMALTVTSIRDPSGSKEGPQY